MLFVSSFLEVAKLVRKERKVISSKQQKKQKCSSLENKNKQRDINFHFDFIPNKDFENTFCEFETLREKFCGFESVLKKIKRM